MLEIPMLSEVNKVFKDNPNFIYFYILFPSTPRLIIFQNPLTPPPPFIMNLRVGGVRILYVMGIYKHIWFLLGVVRVKGYFRISGLGHFS